MKKVAEALKLVIEDKGVSYSFIASKTGISVDAISRTFLGKRRFPADEMVLIGKAVGIDLVQLINDCTLAS